MAWRSGLAGVLGLVVLGVCGLLGAPLAVAAEPSEVTRVGFTQVLEGGSSARIEVSFDRALTSDAAAGIARSLSTAQVLQTGAVERLRCQQDLTRSDKNGTWGLRYACFPQYAVLNWHYRLSPAVQATVVGLVDEQGLSWWRNGVRQPRNSDHPGEPADYLFHGTMKKVWNGDVVDYQDYISWRHNIGPGGRISVTFAGSVALG